MKQHRDFRFAIIKRDSRTPAKVGRIYTSHGVINTPAFVPVGTAASLKSLTKEEIRMCGIEVFFVNTYHMIFRPGLPIIKKMKGLHNFMNWDGPLMTDSGGFQAFSLGQFGPRNTPLTWDNLVKITNNGIFFKSAWDGKEVFLGPQESIQAQQILGADIMMAFDECTFYPVSKKYATVALERTHLWAGDCLKYHTKKNQALYGIIQGSVFRDLRRKSAEFFSHQPFAGFAIGSVANSREPREKVFSVLDWSLPSILPMEKPVHFLGIGEIEDIFISVSKGIDSFDCVIPTRLARMGWLFNKKAGLKNKFRFDIIKAEYSADAKPIEDNCGCYTCLNHSRSYLHHLFRCKELLAYRLATIHNLFFYGRLMNDIRSAIYWGKFHRLMNRWLK